MHFVCKLNKSIYRCITDDITTDEVIITDERVEHIEKRHPGIYELIKDRLHEAIEEPDYIVEANKPKTALILKEYINEDGLMIKLALRLATSTDDSDYMNSIITLTKIDEKEWKRLLRNKKILYTRDKNDI